LPQIVTSIDSTPDRPKPIWLGLCFVLGAGLALWSLYLVGVAFLLLASGALRSAKGSRRRLHASLVALILGFEAGMASLAVLYFLAWGQRSAGWYLYLGALAVAGLVIVLTIMWWREPHTKGP
jgi:hypothetical protein